MPHARTDRACSRSRLIYLAGPSGSGKDSLLEAARSVLAEQGIEIARRIITRSAESVGEDALGVSPVQFEQLRKQGAFAMNWQANGLCYGIALQIDTWLQQGKSVLVNGSRGYLHQARARYPDLLVICLEVAPQVLRQRLLARGREPVEEIEQRLARNAHLSNAQAAGMKHLDNSGELGDTLRRLLTLLQEEGLIARPPDPSA